MKKMLLSFIVVLAFFSCEYQEPNSQDGQNNLNFKLDLNIAAKSLADYGKSISYVEVSVYNDQVTYSQENLSYDETTEIATGTITGILPGLYEIEIYGYFDDGSTVEKVLKGSASEIEVFEGNTTLVDISLWIIINGGIVELPDAGSINITGTVNNTEHTTTINVEEHHWISSVSFTEPDDFMPDDIGSTTWSSNVNFTHTIENVNPGDVLVFKINLVDPLNVSGNVPSSITLSLGGNISNHNSLTQTTASEFESTGTTTFSLSNTGFYGDTSYTSLNGFWINLNTSEAPSEGQTIESLSISILVPETFTTGDSIPAGQEINFTFLRWSVTSEGDLSAEPFPLIF